MFAKITRYAPYMIFLAIAVDSIGTHAHESQGMFVGLAGFLAYAAAHFLICFAQDREFRISDEYKNQGTKHALCVLMSSLLCTAGTVAMTHVVRSGLELSPWSLMGFSLCSVAYILEVGRACRPLRTIS